jgi:hypothetical protein
MTQAQFSAMVSTQWKQAKEAYESQEGYFQEQAGIIQGEWGAAAAERLEAINRFLANERQAPQSLKEAFSAGKVSAEDARFWYDVVTRMEEGSEIAGQTSERVGVTPMEAMERVNELTARLTARGAQQLPNYSQLVQERVRYMKLANGQAA